MTNPIILFRKDMNTEEEFEIAKNYFDVVEYRSQIPTNSLVIPRYSALPFYKELEQDIIYLGSTIVNSFREHSYIADFQYYWDIEDLTPKTYFKLEDIPNGGPYVVKGVTNSRKHLWNELMFAPNRKRAIEIALELQKDSLIGQQDIIVREFEQLKILEIGVTGTLFANEWRFFCFKDKILSNGYYWTCSDVRGEINDKGIDLVKEVIKRVEGKVNFYVIDIAEKENGDWIVIEMNDGQMSGLSENNPHDLYSNMRKYCWRI